MKRLLAFGFLLCVVTGFVVSGTSVNALAAWSYPEPSGIIAFQK